MEKKWLNEPNEEKFEHAGLKCAIIRHQHLGHLCGYVGVTKRHRDYGKSKDEIPVEVHGGVTYAKKGYGGVLETNLWWIGFDCAHYGDLAPAWGGPARNSLEALVYRDFDYVRAQVRRLAEQLRQRGSL